MGTVNTTKLSSELHNLNQWKVEEETDKKNNNNKTFFSSSRSQTLENQTRIIQNEFDSLFKEIYVHSNDLVQIKINESNTERKLAQNKNEIAIQKDKIISQQEKTLQDNVPKKTDVDLKANVKQVHDQEISPDVFFQETDENNNNKVFFSSSKSQISENQARIIQSEFDSLFKEIHVPSNNLVQIKINESNSERKLALKKKENAIQKDKIISQQEKTLQDNVPKKTDVNLNVKQLHDQKTSSPVIFLQENEEPELTDYEKRKLWKKAIAADSKECIKNLVKKEIFYTIKRFESTPLHDTILNASNEIFEYLLNKEIFSVDHQNETGLTTLSLLCKSEFIISNNESALTRVNLLLENKADPNCADFDGQTPLLILCKNYWDQKFKEVPKPFLTILLNAGADVKSAIEFYDTLDWIDKKKFTNKGGQYYNFTTTQSIGNMKYTYRHEGMTPIVNEEFVYWTTKHYKKEKAKVTYKTLKDHISLKSKKWSDPSTWFS
jgi:hypothetical protein